MKRRLPKLLLPFTVVLLLATAWALGLGDHLDIEALRAFLQDLGPLGAIAFILLFALLQSAGLVSVYVWVIAASLVWPTPLALVLSWAGGMGSALWAWVLSRHLARDKVQERIPPWVRRFDQRLSEGGFWAVLVMRVFFHNTSPVQLLYGLTSLRFGPFLAGTAIGIVPMIVIVTLLGTEIAGWLSLPLAGAATHHP